MLKFKDIKFQPEWKYTNTLSRASYLSGAIDGMLIYSKIIGNLNTNDLPAIRNALKSIYEKSNFLNNNKLIRIADYSQIGDVSIFTKRAYAHIIKDINTEFSASISKTYIVGASKVLRASLALFGRFVNQKFLFTNSIEETFSLINSFLLSKNQPSDINSYNLIKNLCFKDEWTYKSPTSDAYYNSGIIQKHVFYSELKGYITKNDIEKIALILENVFIAGEFSGTNFIRIADYSGIKKTPVNVRKLYALAWEKLCKKYNAIPSQSYIVGASTKLKTTISLANKFLKQNIVFVDSLDEITPNVYLEAPIPEIHINNQLLVSKEDIAEINAIAGSLILLDEQKKMEITVSSSNPLLKVADALILAHDDLLQMRKHEFEAQQELQLSLSRFKDIANNMADWIWETNKDGVFSYCSENIKKILGYTAKELIGKNPFALLTSATKDDTINRFNRIFSKKLPMKNFEYWYTSKNGNEICFNANAVPILDKQNNLIGYRGVSDDITERKRTHKLLVANINTQKEIMDSIDAGILILDPSTHTIEQCNSAAAELFGAPIEKIIGKVCHNFLCPAEENNCPITDCLMSIERAEKIMLTSSRKELPILKTVKCVKIDGEEKLLETFIDINTQKEAEEKLKKQTELQKLIMSISRKYINIPIEEVNDMIDTSLKRITEFVKADRSYIFDYDFEKETASNAYEYCREGVKPQIDELQNIPFSLLTDLTNSHKNGKDMIVENIDKLPNGNLKSILKPQNIKTLLTIPMMLTNNDCTGFVGFDWTQNLHKVTEQESSLLRLFSELLVNIKQRVLADAQLNVEKKNAQVANKAKSEFLANMSHEIRTPLNGVLGMNTLLMDTKLDDTQRSYVQTIRSSGEALLTIINDILDFSKIEAGKLELEKIPFNLLLMLEDFAEIMSIKADDKGLEFLCSANPDVPNMIVGDPGRLRQILVNLTGNAIKFTSSGEVSINVSIHSQTENSIKLKFSVKDTGIGIPEEKQNSLFESFTQADTSTTREFGGTGLGLAISKQLVELMNGEIAINSKFGEGSEFWFLAKFDKTDEQPLSLQDSNVLQNARILIVDDNSTNRQILATQFDAWGIDYEAVADGSSAITALYKSLDNNNPFQMGVLDFQMPGMDGETLGRIIKSDKKLRNTHLLMMTSLGQRGDSKRLREIGFDAYLTKPVRQSELFDALAVVLSGKQHPQKTKIVTRHSLNEMNLHKFRILLVEDNITNQMVATGILNKTGVKVDTAANGREAIRALEKIKYDLVFMDVQMPVMDGLEATKNIRSANSNVRNRKIPIIAMTAHAMQGDRDICIQAGMDDYIAKPIDPLSVFNILTKWLDKKTTNKSLKKVNPLPKEISSNTIDVFNENEFLERMMNDAELAAVIINEFLRTTPQLIADMEQSINNNTPIESSKIAHKIKGSSLNLSASKLVDITAKMEHAGKKENQEQLITLLPKLQKEYKILSTLLKK